MFNQKTKELEKQLEILQQENQLLKQQLHSVRQQYVIKKSKIANQFIELQKELIRQKQQLQAEHEHFVAERQAWFEKFQTIKSKLAIKYQYINKKERLQQHAQQQHQVIVQAVQQEREALSRLKQQYQTESDRWQRQKTLWGNEQMAWQARLTQWNGEATECSARLHALQQQEAILKHQLAEMEQQLSEQQATWAQQCAQVKQQVAEHQVQRQQDEIDIAKRTARLHELQQKETTLKHQLAEMERQLSKQQAAWSSQSKQMKQEAAEQLIRRRQWTQEAEEAQQEHQRQLMAFALEIQQQQQAMQAAQAELNAVLQQLAAARAHRPPAAMLPEAVSTERHTSQRLSENTVRSEQLIACHTAKNHIQDEAIQPNSATTGIEDQVRITVSESQTDAEPSSLPDHSEQQINFIKQETKSDSNSEQLHVTTPSASSDEMTAATTLVSLDMGDSTVGEQSEHQCQANQMNLPDHLHQPQVEQMIAKTAEQLSYSKAILSGQQLPEHEIKPVYPPLAAIPSKGEGEQQEATMFTATSPHLRDRMSLIRRAARKHAVPATPFGRWLAECLLNRHIDGRTDGRPLYAYALNDDEYQSLLDLMGAGIIERGNGAYRDWAACYCLAVSETYRREYDGGEWSWAFFDRYLSIRFKTEPQRYEALEAGLAYWRRPLRRRGDRNRDFLGTLFAEGGLPVKLLLEGDNKFSNLIEHGLQNYRRSLQNGSGLLHCLREKCGGLAKVFQSDEALQLFADTVQILAEWAQCFDLAAQSNAAAYLDTVADGWRSRFPFALPQGQADGLVNRWLGNAAQAQQEAQKQSFSCRHYVADGSDVLMAELTFPERLVLSLKDYQGSTRLQWQLFEGEKPLQGQGGTLYARADENGLTVKLPQQKFNCVRQQRGMPLSVRLFADGIVLHTEMLPESALETDAPLWFASGRDNQWWLFSDNDHTALNGVFRVCLPAGFRLPETAAGTSYQAADGRLWYQGSDGLSAEHDDGRLIVGEQRFGAAGQVRLYGRWFDQAADEGGRPVYSGWPAVDTPSEWPFTHWLINGRRDERRRPAVYGTVRAACYSDKKCLLRRRITVLPEQLKWSWQSANQNRAAVLTVEGAEGLLLKVCAEGCTVTPEGNRFTVEAQDYPENIFLHIGSGEDCLAVLALPLPYDGAHLYDEHGRSEARHLTVNELMGKRVRISGGLSIHLHLRVPDAGIAVESTLPLENGRGEINLYALKPQLVQLLACSGSQDAQVECSVYGDAGQASPWLKLTLARYRGVVVWNHQTFRNGVLCENDSETKQRFVVKDRFSDGLARRDALVNIMRLDAPEQAPVRLPESAYLGNGQYEITPEYGGGLWLVYPDAASPVPFRPALFDNTGQAAAAETVSPLHQAARTYHPQYCPDAIREVVAQMAEQPEHTGWQYFEALQKSFSHLPLSVFEAWKELARQPQALALAVLRLNGDDVFCDRVRNELAVVWEWLPLSAWQQAVQCYRKYWDQIQQQLVGQGLLSAAAPLPLIPEAVLCHSTLLRNHVVRGWLDTEEEAQLTEMFGREHDSAYNRRYNELRGRRLPENLNEALQQWLDRQKHTRFFQSVRQMSKVPYDRSLVWLPVFTAAVKAGMAEPEDIRQPLQNTAQLAAEFYRVYAVDPDWFDGLCAAFSCDLLAAEDDKESS